ncbi:hypothetical protein Tco_1316649 [Tanacetum coccineum]
MASGDIDRDAEYALSKLLQMGTVAEYQNEFEMLIKRVTIPGSLLKSFYISRLKLDLQCLLLRTNPKTLDEAFSLARAAKTRFANLDIWNFLRSNPSTLGEDFFKARITEARFEIIAKEDKEHIVEKKIDVILPLSLHGEFASPEVKGSLDADEDIGIDEVSSAIDGVFDIGESLVVFLKWVLISRSRPLLLMISFENTDVAMGKEVKIQRRIWDPRIKNFLDNTLRTRSNPSTLGEDFFKARITEARFEIIAKEDKEHIVEKKIDVILPLPLHGEFASPEVKGSLDADEDIGVDEVSSAIDGVFDIGESLVVFLKWVLISRSRPLLLMVSFENTDVAMGKEVKIQRRIWDPRIKIFLDNTLRTRHGRNSCVCYAGPDAPSQS